MNTDIRKAFEAMGAEAVVETAGEVFQIDIQQVDGREVYQLRYPATDLVEADVLDVNPRLRHLVLDITSWGLPIGARYLCGHDEQHWFVASLAFERQTATVRGAMEALKPAIVLREQKRKGVKHRRNRRKTAAYVRQGEWFFLPRPMMHVGEQSVANGQLIRGNGKPHQVQWLYQPEGREETFARGAVSHPDHETIYLQVWHRVVQNNEVEPSENALAFTRMMYLD